MSKISPGPERLSFRGVFYFIASLILVVVEGTMWNRLPGRFELATFIVMAVVCALVVGLVPKHDYAMMFAIMPLFLVSSVMGFRRSEQLKLRQTQVIDNDEEVGS